MHSMPSTVEDYTENVGERPTFGPARVSRRKPRMDDLLAESVDAARTAILDFADQEEIGEHLGTKADDERLVTHRFVANVRGYEGWEFFATLARAPRAKSVTVCETGMLPGENSLLAPEWVPWIDRASEEERIRLDAIAAGEDPVKALEAAGFGPEVVEEVIAKVEEPDKEASAQLKKKARLAAKRRKAQRKRATRNQQDTAKDSSKS